MPCHTDPPTYEETRAGFYAGFEHDSPLAEALCAQCQQAERYGTKLVPYIAAWWERHKARDRARVEVELAKAKAKADKEAALSKLSPYERSLLGIR